MASYKRQEQCKIIKYTVLKMFLLTGEVKCFLYLCTIYRHVRKHNKKRINFCEMSSRSFWSFKIKSGREKTGQNVFKTWACATTLTFSTKICHIRYEDIRAWSLTNGGGGNGKWVKSRHQYVWLLWEGGVSAPPALSSVVSSIKFPLWKWRASKQILVDHTSIYKEKSCFNFARFFLFYVFVAVDIVPIKKRTILGQCMFTYFYFYFYFFFVYYLNVIFSGNSNLLLLKLHFSNFQFANSSTVAPVSTLVQETR